MSSITLTVAPAPRPGHHVTKAPLKVTLTGTSTAADLLNEIAAKKKVDAIYY